MNFWILLKEDFCEHQFRISTIIPPVAGIPVLYRISGISNELFMRSIKILLLIVLVSLSSCVKDAPTYTNHGVILGYDKSTSCKDKLIMRLDTSITGYVATGYYSDSFDYQIRNYPSTFQIDTNTIFPIYVLVKCTHSWDSGYCRKQIVDIQKMVKITK